jgi:hypothetical protein
MTNDYDIFAAPRSLSPELRPKLEAEMSQVVAMARGTSEDDRTLAIVATAFLDSVLTQAIIVRLPVWDDKVWKTLLSPDTNTPLGTYTSKVHMARALHIVEGIAYEDLLLVGKIRNKFAHIVGVTSFDNEAVTKYLRRLKSQTSVMAWAKENAIPLYDPQQFDTSSRGRFAYSVVKLSSGLLSCSITDAGFGAACLM